MPDLVETMFSVRERPWHGKGTIVKEALTAAKAIQAAGLDWNVVTLPVHVGGEEQARWQATVREDTGAVLGILGQRYVPVQNEDLFTFFDGVVDPAEGAFYHTGGSLKGGRRVWLLAKVPGDFYVPGVEEDLIENFVLLCSSHDGSLCVTAKHTPVRVVCQNTLSMALSYQASRAVKIRHTSTARSQLSEASELLGLAQKRAEALQMRAAELRSIQMSNKLVDDLFRHVFPSSVETDTAPPSTKVRNARETVYALFEQGQANTLQGMAGTGWAMYNAVAEYADHLLPVRTADTDTLDRTWFGQSAQMKNKAAAVLLGQVKK